MSEPEDGKRSVPSSEERMRMVAEQLGVSIEEAERLADIGDEALAKAVWEYSQRNKKVD